MEAEGNLKDYLSIIYGDDVIPIFDKYVFVYNDVESNKSLNNLDSRQGYIYTTDGSKLITESIDGVKRLENGLTGEVEGYVVFLNKQLHSLYRLSHNDKPIKLRLLVIDKANKLFSCSAVGRYYNRVRPEVKLTYKQRVYMAKGDIGIEYFITHS